MRESKNNNSKIVRITTPLQPPPPRPSSHYPTRLRIVYLCRVGVTRKMRRLKSRNQIVSSQTHTTTEGNDWDSYQVTSLIPQCSFRIACWKGFTYHPQSTDLRAAQNCLQKTELFFLIPLVFVSWKKNSKAK